MKKRINRLALIAGSAAAISSICVTSLASCSSKGETVDDTIGQVTYQDIGNKYTVVTGLSNASSKVKSITIPEKNDAGKIIAYIDKGALKGCPNLETLTIPFIGRSSTSVDTDGMLGYVFGDEMYEGCGSFTWQECESSNGDGSTVYGKYAIPHTLETVNVTNAVKIPAGAFSCCKYIENITINKADITTIENKAFYNCYALNNFDFTCTNGLTTVEKSAFENCITLKKVVLPSTVTTVEESAFASNTSASTILIPKSVKTVGANAFSNAGGVVFVEDSEEGKGAGWDEEWTEAETAVIYDFNSENAYKYVGDWLVVLCGSGDNKYGYLAQWMGNWQQTNITVPGSVTIDGTTIPVRTIGAKCFQENYFVKNVTIEEGVKYIYPNTFQGCTQLQYVTFPSTLEQIRDEAFQGCSQLVGRYEDGKPVKGLDFKNVKQIRNKAFKDCSLITDITMNIVETIGNEAFAYCTHLCPDNTEDEDHALSIPGTCSSIGEGAFKYCFKYAPDGYTSSYYYPTVRFETADGQTAPLITEVPESCFESCGVRVLKPTSGEDVGTVYPKYIRVNVNLGGAHLTKIDDAAFKNCWMYHLTGARYTHLKYIGNYAFYYAQMTSDDSTGGRQDLQMDQEIQYIGDWAFGYCTTVCTLTFNTMIDSDIEGEEGTEMYYNDLRHLGQYAFYGCNNTGFTNLDLSPCVYLENWNGEEPETESNYNAAYTPRYAFAACTNLKTVKLPGVSTGHSETPECTTFTRLPERMFESCTNLQKAGTMVIPKNIVDIRAAVFNGCNYVNAYTIDGTIEYYGSSIFYNNYAVTKITKSDGTSAVEFDPNITTSKIGSSIYYKCEKLENPPLPVGTLDQNYALNSSLFYDNKALTSLTVSQYVYSIGNSCCWGCTSLNSVTLSSATKLKYIYASAFENCSTLAALDFSNTNLGYIYDRAFTGCKANIQITLPKNAITIYSKPFEGLTSSAIVYFRQASTNVTGTWPTGGPDSFKWKQNSSVSFTKTGYNTYTCDSDAFGGTNVTFKYLAD